MSEFLNCNETFGNLLPENNCDNSNEEFYLLLCCFKINMFYPIKPHFVV